MLQWNFPLHMYNVIVPLPATFIHNNVHVLKLRLSNFCISCLTVRTTLISHLTMCAYSPNIFLQNTKLHLHTHILVLIHYSQSSLYDTHTGQQLQHGTIQPPNGGSNGGPPPPLRGPSQTPPFQGGDANYMQYQQGFPPPPGDPQRPWGPQGLPLKVETSLVTSSFMDAVDPHSEGGVVWE